MFKPSVFIIAAGLLITSGLSAQNQTTMKSINHQAPVKCSKSILIKASSERIWQVLTNINN